MGILSSCEPKKLFEYFEWISSVPHGSGNTGPISELCTTFAKEHGFRYIKDDLNNVVIYKQGTPGYENSEPVILQGHIDMVCAKDDDCDIDMSRDGLRLKTDGEWVSAEGTSLGADNGVAVATIMALLDDESVEHPPIEALLTVDEETGMDGAAGFDVSHLKGRRLINMDSEEEGVFTAGCSGGVRVTCSMPVTRQKSTEGEAFVRISIFGLLGGHSGVDIDKGHASANKLMARMLFDLNEKIGISLAQLDGGKLDNVISSRAEALIGVNTSKLAEVNDMVFSYDAVFKREFKSSDPGVTVAVSEEEYCGAVLTESDKKKLLLALLMLPQGVEEMSFDIEGLVQTSLNLGIIRLREDSFDFSFAVRSALKSQKEMLVTRVRAIAEHFGAEVVLSGDYPGWAFCKDSKLLELVKTVYKEKTGKEGVVSAIHGGLECGLFIDKMPGLDCISIGPELHDVHSTRERLNVPSTGRMYELVKDILKRLK